MLNEAEKKVLEEAIRNHTGNLIVTGMIEFADANDKKEFTYFLGEDPKLTESFNLYFHWYNLIHELGHILRFTNDIKYYKDIPILEEKLVNDFAVAYWKEHGEKDKINKVYNIVCKALEKLDNPCGDESLIEYYSDSNNFDKASQDSNMYAYIQFSLVKNAIENINHSLFEELSNQGFKVKKSVNKEKLIYNELNNDIQIIINDAISTLEKYGINIGGVKVFEFHHPHVHCAGKPF